MIPRGAVIDNDEFNRFKNEGMNQKQIAKALKVSESTVSKYVNSKKKIKA